MKLAPFAVVQEFAIQKLSTHLLDKLTYHDVYHTLDVLKQSIIIADLENVTDEEDVFLLKVSALYHDMGFLNTYQGHEEKSCEIADQDLSQFGITSRQKEIIFDLIIATKVPQKPKTKLQEIICDADLDYLGRKDFYLIGAGLYQEFLWQGIVKNEQEWNQIQVRFLENHQYFTPSSINRREKQKQKYLAQIKEKVMPSEELF